MGSTSTPRLKRVQVREDSDAQALISYERHQGKGLEHLCPEHIERNAGAGYVRDDQVKKGWCWTSQPKAASAGRGKGSRTSGRHGHQLLVCFLLPSGL